MAKFKTGLVEVMYMYKFVMNQDLKVVIRMFKSMTEQDLEMMITGDKLQLMQDLVVMRKEEIKRPVRMKRPNVRYSADVYDLNRVRKRSRRQIRRAS